MSRYPRTILGTCCVPWREDYTLHEPAFRRQIGLLIDQGLRDLYIFGTAGEGYAVTETQFDQIVKVFSDEMKGRGAEPMVGLITLSLSTVIERIHRAMALGVRDFQISLPSWGALSDKELFVYFREVCGRFPQCRFLHYNLRRSGRLVQPAEYVELARQHPNLVATKQGTGELPLITGLMAQVPELRHFFTETGFPHACFMGECGFLISLAVSNPERARRYFQAGVNRDAEQVMELQQEILGMAAVLQETVGGEAHMDGAFDKMFSRLHDNEFPLRLLPPYNGVAEETFVRYQQAVKRGWPQWMPSS